MYFITAPHTLNDGTRKKRSANKSAKREEMKYSEQEIPDGDEGVDETVRQMIEMSTEDAEHLRIQELAKRLKRKTDIETVRAIFAHVQANVRYENDPEDKELLIRPRHVLSRRRPFGDCDDMTMALAALYLASGFPVRIRVIEWKYDDDGEPIPFFTHVYPLVYVPSLEGWIPTDAVIEEGGGFGNEQGRIRRRKDYPITQRDIDMATLARLDDRIGFADSSINTAQEPCCPKKRKRPIVLNINNSNSNNINAGNTSNTSRTNSPEDHSRLTYQNQQNPRTQAQYAPRSSSNYSPRSQYQNTPRRTDTYAPTTTYSPQAQNATPQRPSANEEYAPPRRTPQQESTVPQRVPQETAPPSRVPDNRNYGTRPQEQTAPAMGFQSAPPPPPRRAQEQAATEQEQPLRPPPREFDENIESIPNNASSASALRPPPREFDERVEEVPNYSASLRPAPREFDERVEEVPNYNASLRPAPREFDERVDEVPNYSASLRPAPREFDERRYYSAQASTMRSAPREFA
jgi:Transglutaminase-like superfamily